MESGVYFIEAIEKDCVESGVDQYAVYNVETDEEFYINLEEDMFSNIDFDIGGYLVFVATENVTLVSFAFNEKEAKKMFDKFNSLL